MLLLLKVIAGRSKKRNSDDLSSYNECKNVVTKNVNRMCFSKNTSLNVVSKVIKQLAVSFQTYFLRQSYKN